MISRLGLRFLSKNLRRDVWLQHNGNRIFGKCYCCKRKIDAFNFEAAHVQAKSRGGPNTLENLRSTCTPCNRDMRTENLYLYMNRKFK